MSPAQARREAHRILRDASVSMRRDLSEAERLLRLAAGIDESDEIELRRDLQSEYAANPEWFVGAGP